MQIPTEERKTSSQKASAWQAFSGQDPLVPLIASFEDEVSDVSQNKYDYLADTYYP